LPPTDVMTQIADHIRHVGGSDFSVESGDTSPPGQPQKVIVESVTSDSRRVTPGALFCAIPGTITDGRRFIGQAAEKGATAILAPTGTEWPALNDNIARLEADEPRRVLALAAAALYGQQPEHMAAVTGTSGKTSTALFTQQLLQQFGHKTASLGTLGLRADGFPETEALTTPAPEDLHKLLADIAKAGITHCAMEASSHGLDQYRLDGVQVPVAGFTNLGRDHLDYHADEEEYFQAKARLFRDLLADSGTAVINADSDRAPALRQIANDRGCKVVDYGYAAQDIRLVKAVPHSTSIALTIAIDGDEHQISVPLVGTFQAHNVLCALGMAMALDPSVDAKTALEACTKLKGAPGRMDHVATHKATGAPIFVDYAHKPDALDAVLKACAHILRTASLWCLAVAATVTKASGPRWGRLPNGSPTGFW